MAKKSARAKAPASDDKPAVTPESATPTAKEGAAPKRAAARKASAKAGKKPVSKKGRRKATGKKASPAARPAAKKQDNGDADAPILTDVRVDDGSGSHTLDASPDVLVAGLPEQDDTSAEIVSEAGDASDASPEDVDLEVRLDDESPASAGEARAEAPVTAMRPAGVAQTPPASLPKSPEHWDLATQFLVVAHGPGWDANAQKVRAGSYGGALVGALLLELNLQGRLGVQRGRLSVLEGAIEDPLYAEFARAVGEQKDRTSQVAMEKLGKRLGKRLGPWKERLSAAGYATYTPKSFLGMDRSAFAVRPDVQGVLTNRLTRILAGSGVVDARSIALLGLIEASGLLESLVPASALPFNRKRIKGLLSGRDTMGYKVDKSLQAASDTALQQILSDVRVLSGRA